MRARILASPLLVSLLGVAGCSPESGPKNPVDTGPADSGVVEEDPVVETPEAPDSVDVGGFAITGRVMRERSGDGVADLCVDIVDPLQLAVDGPDVELVPLHETATASDGGFTFDDVDMPSTAGLYIRAFDCDGDTTTWFPTATVVLQDAMAGLGPNDALDGVSAWVATSDDVAMVDAAIMERGSRDSILDVGALWGQAFDTDSTILAPAGIRGPDGTRVHYDAGDGTWPAFENTSEDGDGRWVSPGAPYSLWTCRAQAHNVPAVIAGAIPGWVVHWDWRATEDFSAR